MKRAISFIVSIIMLILTTFSISLNVAAEENKINDIVIDVKSEINGEAYKVTYKVLQAAEYTISFEYKPLQNKTTPMYIDLISDGKNLLMNFRG